MPPLRGVAAGKIGRHTPPVEPQFTAARRCPDTRQANLPTASCRRQGCGRAPVWL